MTKEELAGQLHNNEYLAEVSDGEARDARNSNLVIVYGASDDLMEFAGAIDDEVGAYQGKTVMVDKEGLLPERDNIDDDDELERYFIRKKTAKEITANWDDDGYSWTYSTDIPHATFDIVEDGEKYCRGIVFSLDELEARP